MPSASHGRGSSIFGRPRPIIPADGFGSELALIEGGDLEPAGFFEDRMTGATIDAGSGFGALVGLASGDRAGLDMGLDGAEDVGAGHADSDAMVTPLIFAATDCGVGFAAGRELRRSGSAFGRLGKGSVHGFFVMAQQITCAMTWHNK